MTFDIASTLRRLRSHELTLEDVESTLRQNRNELEPTIKAFVHIDPDLDEQLQAKHEQSPEQDLYGIPLAIKDLADVDGMPTTGGSRAYRWLATEDAPAVARLRAAGALLIGKTNTQEFAFGVVTPPTRNPWQPEHIPGGSSGGSAAALASGMVLGALGTDTGGSIRIPAACCGVVGFKPTYGAISKRGVMPLSISFDHVGPLAHTVDGARRLYAAMLGHDPEDPSSRSFEPRRRPSQRRLGVPWSYFEDICDPEVLASLESALRFFEHEGYRIEAVEMESWPLFRQLQMAIRLPEAYLYHREVMEGERRALLDGDLAQRLDPGKDILALDYIAAKERLFAVRRRLESAIESYDAWLLPTLPVPAPRSGQTTVRLGHNEVTVWEALVILTAPFSSTGLPAISVPSGFTAAGLPIGLQMVAVRDGDFDLLDLAEHFERGHGFAGQVCPTAATF